MEFRELLARRRMVRHYTDEPIPRESLERIAATVRRAPSGGYWFVDAGAALMLILLAAIDEGLAAGLFGVTVERMAAFKAIFGIPDDVSVVGVVTLGHPGPDPGWSERASRSTQRRRPLEEVVRWERWSS